MRIRLFGSLLLLFFGASAARSDEFYFVIVFGSQRIPPNPNFAHTFATFVKASGEGPCPDFFTIEEAHTISWLAAKGIVRTSALLPEPGANWELHDTICWALSSCQRISMWGPYQIRPELYCRALKKIDQLESGRVRYKADDSGFPVSRVCNCIHAVSNASGGVPLHILSPGWGENASYWVTRWMGRWMIDRRQKHEWVATALGLDEYPIIHRELQSPRSGPLWSAFWLMLGQEP